MSNQEDQPKKEVKKNPVGRPSLPKTDKIAMPTAPESVIITERYVDFLKHLFEKENSHTKNVYQLAKKMRIQEAALHRIIKNPDKYILPVYAIWWAMENENLNINWLFTGKGKMLNQ